MNRYLKLFENHNQYETYIGGSDAILPNVSLCENENEVHFNPLVPIDYSTHYLTTTALEDGTISFNIWVGMGTEYITSISYSIDDGETWSTTMNGNGGGNITVNVSTGDKVLWKGVAQQTGYYDQSGEEPMGSFFSSTARFDVEGNVMSMLYGDNFVGQTELEYDCQLAYLFSDYYGDGEKLTLVVNAQNLVLPATILSTNCYNSMFCACRTLETAPELPATTLSDNCYSSMFVGCTSLVTAPELPATTLSSNCYNNMFRECTSLNSIKCLATNISATACTTKWLDNVAASGTFTKAASMSSWTTGVNGIPSGWTVQDAQ